MAFIARKTLVCLLVLVGTVAFLARQHSLGESGTGPVVIRAIHHRFSTESTAFAPQTVQAGWPQPISYATSSPVLSDLDGDGVQEIIMVDFQVRVYDASGNMRPGWPQYGDSLEEPAIADLERDGSVEIVISTLEPGLQVFDIDGSARSGWPVRLPRDNSLNVSNPVLADIDGDGILDVGAASEAGVSFFHADGEPMPGWPYLFSDPFYNAQWSAPAVGDLDQDGDLEIVVGQVSPAAVHVIRSDGSAMPGWPKIEPAVEPVFSSPALADLDDDGDLEIVVQEGDVGGRGNRMWVWNADGSNVAGWPRVIADIGGSSRSSPAITDVNNDGVLEIVTATGDGRLHIFRPDGTELPGYPRNTGGLSVISSPSVVDADGDHLMEIFLAYTTGIAPGGLRQVVSGWRLNGTVLPGFPAVLIEGTDLAAHASLHISDIDGDDDLEVAAAGTSFSGGLLWVLPIAPSVTRPGALKQAWPQRRRDTFNSGTRPSVLRNLPPIAQAGANLNVECEDEAGTGVTLDGRGSSDPDGDRLTYNWTGPFFEGGGRVIGFRPAVTLPLGEHRIALTVDDGDGGVGSDEVGITIRDRTPPAVSCPGAAVEECESAGQADVDLPPANATDRCQAVTSITNDHTSHGPDASGAYALGSTTVTYAAKDGAGNSATCTTAVTVVDTAPPILSVAVDPVALWPPNHRLVRVSASLASSDACDTPTVALTSIMSSEPDNGEQDGDTIDDIQGAGVGTADTQFELRAERAGGGGGRSYAAVYTATDGSGNEARTAVLVLVPRDQGGRTDPIEITVEQHGLATVVRWNPVAGAESYNVIRGNVSDIRDAGPVVDLGPVVCLGSRIPDSLLRKEDADAPNPGEAYFYLVEYDDGARSSYGEEGADKPRAAGPGDCQ